MSTIRLKRSAEPGKVPSIEQLELGEVAVNTHDGKMFMKRDQSGNFAIKEFGARDAASNVFYVTQDGSNTNDGKTIGDAFATIDYALKNIPEGSTLYVKAGQHTVDNPVKLPAFVAIVGDSLRTTFVQPKNPAEDIFWVNNGCFLKDMRFNNYIAPSAAVSFPPDGSAGSIMCSPYVQNCTSYTTTGTGMRVDGSVVTGLRSMVVDAYTQYNQGGIGVHHLNRGNTQLVSIFTISCDISIMCESGGFCSLTNSNTSFGNYGLISDGYSEALFGASAGANISRNSMFMNDLVTVPFIQNASVFSGTGEVYTISEATPIKVGQGVVTGPSLGQEDSDLVFARERILANREVIQRSTVDFVKDNYQTGGEFDEAKCARDSQLILDGVGFDVALDTNFNSVYNGISYQRANAKFVVNAQFEATKGAIDFLKAETAALLSGTSLTRANAGFDDVKGILDGGVISTTVPGDGVADALTFSSTLGVTDGINARTILQANIAFLQAEVLAFNDAYNATAIAADPTGATTVVYDREKCQRDVQYIVDALSYDAQYGGNSATVSAMNSYIVGTGIDQLPADQRDLTADSYAHLADMVAAILTDPSVDPGTKLSAGSPDNSAAVTAASLSGTIEALVDTFAGVLIEDATPAGTPIATIPAVVTPNVTTLGVAAEFTTSQTAITNASTQIVDDVIAFVNQEYNFSFNQEKCARDLQEIIDAAKIDAVTNSLYNQTVVGLTYTMESSAYLLNLQKTQTAAGIQYARDLVTADGNFADATDRTQFINAVNEVINILNTGTQTSDLTTGTFATNFPTSTDYSNAASRAAAAEAIIGGITALQSDALTFLQNGNAGVDFDFSTLDTEFSSLASGGTVSSNELKSVYQDMVRDGTFTKCQRDVAYLAQAVAFDTMYGGNSATLRVAKSYFVGAIAGDDDTEISQLGGGQKNATLALYAFLAGEIAADVSAAGASAGLGSGTGASKTINQLVAVVTDHIDADGVALASLEPVILDNTNDATEVQTVADIEAVDDEAINDTIFYLQDAFVLLDFNESKCYRDTGIIIDAVVDDMVLGTNYKSVVSGRTYSMDSAALVIADQKVETVAAINHARDEALGFINDFSSNASKVTAYNRVQSNFNLITDLISKSEYAFKTFTVVDAAYNPTALGNYGSTSTPANRVMTLTIGQHSFTTTDTVVIAPNSLTFQCYSSDDNEFQTITHPREVAGQSADPDAVSPGSDPAFETPVSIVAVTDTTITVDVGVNTGVGNVEHTFISATANGITYGNSFINYPMPTNVLPEINRAFTNIKKNKAYLIEEAVAHIDQNYPLLGYDRGTCERDIGLIIDAVSYDAMFDSNFRSITAGKSYLRGVIQVIAGDVLADETTTTTGITGTLLTMDPTTTVVNPGDELTVLPTEQKLATIESFRKLRDLLVQITFDNDTKERIVDRMDLIIDIVQDGESVIPAVSIPTVDITANDTANYTTNFNAAGVPETILNIENSREFIVAETKAFIDSNFPALLSTDANGNIVRDYNAGDKCERDVGLILDALKYDLTYGGNMETLIAGKSYFSDVVSSADGPVDLLGSRSVNIDIVNAGGIQLINPITITTAIKHGLVDGAQVTLLDISGVVELTGKTFFVKRVSDTVFEVYDDAALTTPLDGTTGFTAYANLGGTVRVNAAEVIATVESYNFLADLILTLGNGTAPVNPQQTIVAAGALTTANGPSGVRAKALVDDIITIIENDSSVPVTLPADPSWVTGYNANETYPLEIDGTDLYSDFLIMQGEKDDVQAEITKFIEANFAYDKKVCRRDMGYIIDATLFDGLYNGNSASYDAARQYYTQGKLIIPAIQRKATGDAMELLRKRIGDILRSNRVVAEQLSTSPTLVLQDTTTPAATITEILRIQKNFDVLESQIRRDYFINDFIDVIDPDFDLQTETANKIRDKILAEKENLQVKTIKFIDTTFREFRFDREVCSRDVGLILDAVAMDVALGTNYNAIIAGLSYQRGSLSIGTVKDEQKPQTIAAIEFLKTETLAISGLSATGVARATAAFDEIIDIFTNGETSTRTSADAIVYPSPTGVDTDKQNSHNLLRANRDFISEEIIEWIEDNFTNFEYDEFKCERDTRIILDAIALDAALNTNYNTITVALAYKRVNAQLVITDQLIQTVAAMDHLRKLIDENKDLSVIGRARMTRLIDDIVEIVQSDTTDLDVFDSTNFDSTLLNAYENIEMNAPKNATQDEIDAKEQLKLNKEFLASEVLAFINLNNPTLEYVEAKCKRDVKFLLDAAAFDLLYGGNSATVQAANSYFVGTANQLGDDEIQATIDAYNHLKTVIEPVVLATSEDNNPVYTPTVGNSMRQIIDSDAATATEVAAIRASLDIVIARIQGTPTPTLVKPSLTGADANLIKDFNEISEIASVESQKVVDYVNDQFANFTYDIDKCARDVKLVVLGAAIDLEYSSNYNSVTNGLSYLRGNAKKVSNAFQKAITLAALDKLKTLAATTIGTGTGYAAAVTAVNTSIDTVKTIFDAGLVGITPTNAVYDPTTGVMDLTIGEHTFIQGDTITLEPGSLKFTCASDGNNVVQAYPRTSDPAFNYTLKVIDTGKLTISVNVGVSTETSAHTFITADEKAIKTGALPNAVPALTFAGIDAANDSAYAAKAILANKAFIAAEMSAYVVNDPNFILVGNYDETKCRRDSNNILDAVALDLRTGSNYNSLYAGIAYTRANSDYVISAQKSATIAAIEFLRDTVKALSSVDAAADTRIDSLFAIIIAAINSGATSTLLPGGAAGVPTLSIPTPATPIAGGADAAARLTYNRDALAEEVLEHINQNANAIYLSMDQAKCSRDVKYIVEGLAHDAVYGGNIGSKLNGEAYFVGNDTEQLGIGQRTATIAAYQHLASVIEQLVGAGIADAGFTGVILVANPTQAWSDNSVPNAATIATYLADSSTGLIETCIVAPINANKLANFYTPTAASYVPTTGVLTLTVTGNPFSNGDTIRLAERSIGFKCQSDGFRKVFYYPRTTDPALNSDLTISNVAGDSFDVQIGVSSEESTHQFVGPATNAIIDSTLPDDVQPASAQYVTTVSFTDAATAIVAGSGTAVDSTISYINSDLSFNQTKCERDTGYIVEALTHDTLYGGNYATTQAALAYRVGVAGQLGSNSPETTATVAAYGTRLPAVVQAIVEGGALTPSTGNSVTQVANANTVSPWTTANASIAADIQNIVDVIEHGGDPLSVDASMIAETNITEGTIYDAESGVLTLTLSGTSTGLVAGTSTIRLARNSLTFTCASDSHVTSLTYPDKDSFGYDRELRVLSVAEAGNTTITVNIGNARKLGATSADRIHRFVSAAANAVVLPISPTRPAIANTFATSLVTKADAASDNFGDLINAYLLSDFPTSTYDRTRCKRDVGFIVDALSYDVLYGGNSAMREVARSYFSFGLNLLGDDSKETDATIFAYEHLSNIIGEIVQGVQVGKATGNLLVQTYDTASTLAEAAVSQTLLKLVTDTIRDRSVNKLDEQELPDITWAASEFQNDFANITFNKSVAQADTLQFIDDRYTTFSYDQFKCSRDVGLILDAVLADMVMGGNYQSLLAGSSYYRASAFIVKGDQLPETIESIKFLKKEVEKILTDPLFTATVVPGTYPNPTIRAITPLEAIENAKTLTEVFGDTTEYADLIARFDDVLRVMENGLTNAAEDQIQYVAPTGITGTRVNAKDILLANKEFFVEESVAFIKENFPLIGYDRQTCERDVGLVLDALGFDLMFGSNMRSITAGRSYFREGAAVVSADQKKATLAAFEFLKVKAAEVVSAAILSNGSYTAPGGNKEFIVTVGADSYEQKPTGVFYLDGVEQPIIELDPGAVYTFNQDEPTNAYFGDNRHPLVFSTTRDGDNAGGTTYDTGIAYYLDGVSVDEAQYERGFARATLRRVELDLRGKYTTELYYAGGARKGMGNLIYVKAKTTGEPIKKSIQDNMNVILALLDRGNATWQPYDAEYKTVGTDTSGNLKLYIRENPFKVGDKIKLKPNSLTFTCAYDTTTPLSYPDYNGATGAAPAWQADLEITAADDVSITVNVGDAAGAAATEVHTFVSADIDTISLVPGYVTPSPTGYDAGTYLNTYKQARDNIEANREFIIADVVAFIETNDTLLGFDRATCARDTGLIIDALSWDLVFDSNQQSITAGRGYLRQDVGVLPATQTAATIAGFDRLRDLLLALVIQTGADAERAKESISANIGLINDIITNGDSQTIPSRKLPAPTEGAAIVPTAITYTPADGLMVITSEAHGLSVGDYVMIADESLTFTCESAPASGILEKISHPRSNEYASRRAIIVSAVADANTYTINIDPNLDNSGLGAVAHTFVSASANAIKKAEDDQGKLDVFFNISAQRTWIIDAVEDYIEDAAGLNQAAGTWNTECREDMGLVIDAALYDLMYGTNLETRTAAQAYTTDAGALLLGSDPTERANTISAYLYLADLLQQVGNDVVTETLYGATATAGFTATGTVPGGDGTPALAAHDSVEVVRNYLNTYVANAGTPATDKAAAEGSLPAVAYGARTWSSTTQQAIFNQFQSERVELQDAVTAFIEENFAYVQEKCKRDVGYILDAVYYDMTYGGNSEIFRVGKSYFSDEGVNQLSTLREVNATQAAYGHLESLVEAVAIGATAGVTALTQQSDIAFNPTTVDQTSSNAGSNQAKLLITNVLSFLDDTINRTNVIPTVSETTPATAWVAADLVTAATALTNAKRTVQDETTVFIEENYAYIKSKCERDIRYIVDAVAYDIFYSGNSQAHLAAEQYFDGGNYQIPVPTKNATVQTFKYLLEIMSDAVRNITVSALQNRVIQTTTGASATSFEADRIKDLLTIIVNLVQHGYSSQVTFDVNITTVPRINESVTFHQTSLITASGQTFEWVGSGTNIQSAVPYKGGQPVEAQQVVESNEGKVYFTSTDQKGDFKIGNSLTIERASGTITGQTFDRSLFAVLTPYILSLQ
jgi:hypothetical protein